MTEFLKQLADSVDKDKNVLKVKDQKRWVTKSSIEARFDLWIKEQPESELLEYYKNHDKLENDFVQENKEILEGSRVELRSLLSSIMAKDSRYFREDGIMTDAVNYPKIDQVLHPLEYDSTLYLDISWSKSWKLKSYYRDYQNGIVPIRYDKRLATYVVSYGPKKNQRAYVRAWMRLDFSVGSGGQVIPSVIESAKSRQASSQRVEQKNTSPNRSVERRVEKVPQTPLQKEFDKAFFITHSFGSYYKAEGWDHFHGLQVDGLTSAKTIDEFKKSDTHEIPSLTEQLISVVNKWGRIVLDVGGINDITAQWASFESVKENYINILRFIASKVTIGDRSKIVIVGISPIQERRNTKYKGLSNKITAFNKGLSGFCTDNRFTFVPREQTTGLVIPNWPDGVHYSLKYASTMTQYLIDKVNIPPQEPYSGKVADINTFKGLGSNAAELEYLMGVYGPLLWVNKNDVKSIAMIESMMKSGARDPWSRCIGIMQLERNTIREVRRKPAIFNHKAFWLTANDFNNPLNDRSNMRIALALLSGIEKQYYDGITARYYTEWLDLQLLKAQKNRQAFSSLVTTDLKNRWITMNPNNYQSLYNRLQSDRWLRKRMATIGRYNGNTSTVSGWGKHWFKYAFEALLLSEYAPQELVQKTI